MRVTLNQIRNSFPALQQLAQVKLPARLSYRLTRTMASAETEVKATEKAMQGVMESHGCTPNGNQWEIPKDKIAAVDAELGDLLKEEVDLWGDPIDVELLGDVEIAPATLMLLDWLIIDGSAAEAEKAQAANG